MLTLEELENRFKKNMINVTNQIIDYIGEAISRGILDGLTVNILYGTMPEVQNYLERKSGRDLIEGFIYCSRSDEDCSENNQAFRERKYPEYWDIFRQLPTLEEYKQEKENPEKAKPLPEDAEQFFMDKLHVIFPLVKPFKDVIRTLYTYKDNQGNSFLSIIEKKYIALIFRSFPILSIKYINLQRNPVVENGRITVNKDTGRILYRYSDTVYLSDISVKNAMKIFNLTIEDLLKWFWLQSGFRK